MSVDWTVVPVTLTTPGNQDSVGSTSINLALSADVASGYTASYGVSGLPSGLSVNSSTGIISGTLDSGDTNNTYLVTVTATAGGVTASQQFSWTVGTVVVTPLADQTSTEGNTVSLAVAAGTVSGTLSYSASGLPTGLSINSTTGVISGTLGAGTAIDGPWGTWELSGGVTWDGPYQPGETPTNGINRFVATGTELSSSYAVTVVASNGTVSASQTFNWAVQPKAVVTALAEQQNVAGASVSLAVTASEAGATLSYSATGLPSGLTINSSTGVISGTVATGAASVGTYGAAVTVGDGTYSSAVFFGWAIQHGDNHAPVLTAPATQVNTVGDGVNLALSASDIDGDTLAYSVDNLPDGVTIDSTTGVISGSVFEDALQTAPYAVTVTVDDGNGGTTTQTFNWIVNDSALTVSAISLTDSAGADSGTVTVATFTDTDPNWDPSAFTATITWGDGSSDAGAVAGSNGSYTVTGDHVYDHAGTYAMQVSVTDGFTTMTATGTAIVNDSTITLSGGVKEGTVAGTSVTGTWASFTDTNRTSAATSYTAVLNWGDGSATTTGSVTGEDGQFIVSGTHAYAGKGANTVTVTLTDRDGTTAMVNSTAQVGDLFAGDSATLTVATFTVADSNASAGGYTAVVTWGDGSSDYGTVTGSSGVFTVTGTHTYTTDSLDAPNGTDTVTVTLTGPNETTLNSSGNQTLTATKAVSVERPPMTGFADEVLGTPSVAFTNAEVATFTEPDVGDSSSEFTATINWGDGTSSVGTVTGSDGLFHVLGSHSYAAPGSYAIQVDVSQAWNFFASCWQAITTAQVSTQRKSHYYTPPQLPDITSTKRFLWL